MRLPEGATWPRIPGYDSGDDSDDAEETDILSTAQARLQMIVKVLGDRWIEWPFIDFVPAPKPLKDTVPPHKPPPRYWGPHGPPPCFSLQHVDAPIVRETFISNGFCWTQEKDWLVQWCGPSMKSSDYASLHEYQRVNHFPGSTELTRKDRMCKHLEEMAQTFGKDSFDFVPQTFVLPEQVDEFLSYYHRTDHLWIVKPSASSRGRGIFLLRDVSELPLDESSVVSRYVDRPLLIQGLKFDLRVYALVTSFEPLRAYVYREGLTRFASSPYSTDEEHLQDAYRHLTNYSINKSAQNFVENQEVKADNVGHKWSLSALNKHLKCVGIDVELMWDRIMDLILKTLFAVEPVIGNKTRKTASHRTNCFELYGFDVLVDETLKPWLIEVNLSPSMQAESPLDWQVKSSLLCDTFNLVGIHDGRQANSTSRLRSKLMEMRRSSSSFALAAHLANPNRPPSASSIPFSAQLSMQPGRPPSATLGTQLRNLGQSTCANLAFGSEMANTGPGGRRRPASPSMKSTWPPPQRARNSLVGALLGNGQADSEQADEEPSVILDMLSEGHLKMLADAMREVPRRHNFIRLFPTPATVEKYAALCEPRASRSCDGHTIPPCRASGSRISPSQLLASVLFGPTPVRASQPVRSRSTPMLRSGRMTMPGSSPGRHGENIGNYGGEGADTEESPRASSSQQASSSRMAEATKLLRQRSGHRLLLMEYLIRVDTACKALGSSEKAKLAQGREVSARLASFRQQLQGIMNKSSSTGLAEDAEFRGEWMLLALTSCPVGASEASLTRTGASASRRSFASRATPCDSSSDGASLIDELCSVCRKTLLVLLQDTWAVEAPHEEVPAAEELLEVSEGDNAEHDSGEISLEDCLPPLFSQSAAGQKALDIVSNLSPAELERVLQAPKQPVSSSRTRGCNVAVSESSARSLGATSTHLSGAVAGPEAPRAYAYASASAALRGVVSAKVRHGPYVMPSGGARRVRAEASRPNGPSTTPAERAHGVLASSVAARTEPPMPPPRPSASAGHARTVPLLPELAPEALTPLRHRSSSSVKMRLTSKPERPTSSVRPPPPVHIADMHAGSFHADIEL